MRGLAFNVRNMKMHLCEQIIVVLCVSMVYGYCIPWVWYNGVVFTKERSPCEGCDPHTLETHSTTDFIPCMMNPVVLCRRMN